MFFVFLLFIVTSLCGGPCETIVKDEAVKYKDIVDCLHSLAYDEEIHRQAVEYVSTLLDLYVYRDIVIDSGEPWNQAVDIQKRLADLSMDPIAYGNTDFAFQEELRDVVATLKDAHTAYIPPECYHFRLYQPFPIRQNEDGSFEITDFWDLSDINLEIPKKFKKVYPTRTDLYMNHYKGCKILKINDKEPQEVISDYAETQCAYSRDPMIRYNQVLRSEWHKRTTMRNRLPDSGIIKYTIEFNGTVVDIDAPWIGVSGMTYLYGQMKQLCGYEKPEPEEDQTGRRSGSSKIEEEVSSFLHSPPMSYLPSRNSILQKIIREQLNVYEIQRQVEFSEARTISSSRREEGLPKLEMAPKGYKAVTLAFEVDHEYIRLYYNNVTKVAVLKVITFMPDMDILGPQTEEKMMDALTAFRAYFEQTYSAFDNMKRIGARKVILDVRGNTGGVGCLAFVLLRYLSPYAPLDPSPNSDLVYTKLGDELHCKFNIIDRLTFYNQDRKPVSSDWYSKGKKRTRGGRASEYSSLVHFGCSMQMMILGAGNRWENSPIMFEPEDITVFTDGSCGSTCGIFVKLVQYLELGRVVSQGGSFKESKEVQRNMDCVSFPGGAVMTGSTLLSEMSLYSSVCPISEENKILKPYTKALVTFAWMEIYPWSPKIAAFELKKVDDSVPMGHTKKPADFHIQSWDFGSDILGSDKLVKYFDVCADWMVQRNDDCIPKENPVLHGVYGYQCINGSFDKNHIVLRGCDSAYYLSEDEKECLPMPEEYDLIGMAVKVLLAGFFVAATIICFYLCYFCYMCSVIMMICIACVVAVFKLSRKKRGTQTNRNSLDAQGNDQGEDEMGEYARLPAEEDAEEPEEVEMEIEDNRRTGLLADQDDIGIIN